jgi:hypothetical protein
LPNGQIIDTFTQVRNDIYFLCVLQQKYPEGVVFNLAALTKTVKKGEVLKSCFHPRFNEEPDLCPCTCLEEYEGRTSIYRVSPPDQANLLFLSLIRPFKPVSSSTIARWVKEVSSLSGIYTTKFKAHSTRGASATVAADRGISISEILQLGHWSQESTFQKFYYRPQFNTSGGRAILSSGMDNLTLLLLQMDRTLIIILRT